MKKIERGDPWGPLLALLFCLLFWAVVASVIWGVL